MKDKASFERIFRATGTHLAVAALGFMLAVVLFAPKPRARHVDARVATVLELGRDARALAADSASPVLGHAIALCQKLAWPKCDATSVRQMGMAP